MNITTRNLFITAIVVFLAGIIALFPARVAYQSFAPDTVRLSGISGTLWSGNAREGEVSGLYLRNLDWTLRPAGLLRGALVLDVALSPGSGFLEARVDLAASGAMRLSDLNAGFGLSALRSLLPLENIDGNLQVQLKSLSIANGLPVDANGTIDIAGLTIRQLSPLPIGSYRMRLSGGDDGISGSVEDIGGMFDIAGSIRLDAERNYEVRGLIVPTAEAPANVVRQLQVLGSPNERGQREFRLEGAL